jgi:hypothetical protein
MEDRLAAIRALGKEQNMTDATYTHYVILVDRTGSMEIIAKETEAGIAEYVREQAKLEGRATLTLYEFDSWHDQPLGGHAKWDGNIHLQVNTVCDFADISEVPAYHLVPRGMTPLLDAVGMTVTETGEKLAALPESKRPGMVIFVIVTDGQENDSKEWTSERVRSLTQQQERDYGWRFTYLGANQDAFAQAGDIGIAAAAAVNYNASHAGTQNAWGAAGKFSARTRTAGPGGQSAYTQAERDAAEEK